MEGPNQFYLYSALSLAFVGDSVYELLVRTHLSRDQNVPAGKLNSRSVGYVSAGAQSVLCEAVLPVLSEEEADIFRRGRNAHPRAKAKNATTGDYMRATGLEALFGYLWLCGRKDRIDELFTRICQMHDQMVDRPQA